MKVLARMLCVAGWLLASFFFLLTLLHPIIPEAWDVTLPIGSAHIDLPLREIFTLLWQNLLSPAASFLMVLLDRLTTWPVAAVVIAYLVLGSGLLHSLFPELAKRVRSFEFLGVGFELSAQIRELRKESHDLQKLIPSIQDSTAKTLKQHVEDMRLVPAVGKLVKSVAEEIRKLNANFDPEGCRATIHIQDLLFADRLLQLLDYFDAKGEQRPGQTAGRSFSIRRGIIGRVWRSGIPEIAGVLPSAETQEGTNEQNIARIWGLTLDEAEWAKKYPSYICVPFGYSDNQRALFYMDSIRENAFVSEDKKREMIEAIGALMKKAHVHSALGDLHEAVKEISPRLQIFDRVGRG